MGFNRDLVRKQLALLEQGNLNEPHDVLGMHLTDNYEGGQHIRVFCPSVSRITAIDYNDETKRYDLSPVDYNGLFEGDTGRREKFLYKLECEAYTGDKWTYIDPYQFETTLTADDLYLFGTGKDYQIHHKLGAQFKVVDGIRGISFAVWAPHAKRVSVIGNFNNWDGRRHAMRFIPTHGVWEIFIPGLENFDVYKYEIKTQTNTIIYKADPYAKCGQLRPDNASVIYDLSQYEWEDQKWMEERSHKNEYKEAVSIYEVHIGSWKKHSNGDFYNYREVADALVKYVKEMGYTHVELMGIIEHPYDGSWGYQVTGYFAPTSRYGTPDDFRYFIEKMHDNHIGVILDWVPAHFPKDAFALEKFDGQALYENADERKAHHPHWGTLIFDYGKPQVSLFLIASALSWLEDYHIDGLRVDAVASMLYLDYGRQNDYVPNKYGGRENLEAVEFFKHLNQVAYENCPGIMMIAEESTAWPKVCYPPKEGGLGFGFKWNMGWMNDFLSYMKTYPTDRKYKHSQITFSLMYAFSENFIQVLSHDEVVHGKSAMIGKMPGEMPEKFANLRLAYGYMFMHPGKKMLFMGDEFAQTREWNEKVELDWNLLMYPEHQQIKAFVKDLNHLYTSCNALWEVNSGYENFEWIDCDNSEQSIISFIRKGETVKDTLLIVVNFMTNSWENYRIGAPMDGVYEEILNSDDIQYGGEGRLNGKLTSDKVPWHGRPQSIAVTIPPLSICVFEYREAKQDEEKKKKRNKK